MSRAQDDIFGNETTAARGPGSGALAAITVLVLCLGGWFFWDRQQAKPVTLAASQGRLTLTEKSEERTVFDRRESPEIWYRVLLDSAPLNRRIHLVGEWLDPAGRVAHRNAYDTKPISHLPWETHVRFRLPADAVPGTWRVRLLADGGELHAVSFEVGDGIAAKGGGL